MGENLSPTGRLLWQEDALVIIVPPAAPDAADSVVVLDVTGKIGSN